MPRPPGRGDLPAYPGYATDLITDFALDWLKGRDPQRPFCLMLHHKAPHRPWEPDAAHAGLYEDAEVPYPETFEDDYATRAQVARVAHMRMEHLNERDTRLPAGGALPAPAARWKYQRYIRDYLKCIASIDDNVGRVLAYLDQAGLSQDTVLIYTSDQGFFLGDHGWFDKRFFYEESLRMPFLRYLAEIAPGSAEGRIVLNTDFAPLPGLRRRVPEAMQGRSFRPCYEGRPPRTGAAPCTTATSCTSTPATTRTPTTACAQSATS